MLGLESDTWVKLGWLLYFLVGIPIAWIFIKREKMDTSVKEAPANTSAVVIGLLALMWPILLFCVALNYSQDKADQRRLQAKDQPDQERDEPE